MVQYILISATYSEIIQLFPQAWFLIEYSKHQSYCKQTGHGQMGHQQKSSHIHCSETAYGLNIVSIHPFSIFAYTLQVDWGLFPLTLGEMWDAPWIDDQFLTGLTYRKVNNPPCSHSYLWAIRSQQFSFSACFFLLLLQEEAKGPRGNPHRHRGIKFHTLRHQVEIQIQNALVMY